MILMMKVMLKMMIEIEIRMVRLIIILYGVWNLIVMIGIIVIINIDIQNKLVITISLGVIVMLNSPFEVVEIEII